MTQTAATDRQRFNRLLTDVAGRLMTISASTAGSEIETALDQLRVFFGADTAFLRRHDLAERRSTLIAHVPSATDDTVSTEAGFDENPLLAAGEHQRAPLITFRRESGSTLATFPLLQGSETIGVLGITHLGSRRWHDEELRALSSIAALTAQLWTRVDAEQRTADQLHYDELTGLPNRRKLTEAITNIGENHCASLLIIDVDNMKAINDGLDFETGNLFIAGLAQRLVSSVRDNALIARLSGDQFAVLVVDTSPKDVERLGRRLVGELAATVRINEISIARSVSVGVAHDHRPQGPNADHAESEIEGRQLLAEASAALHQAKLQGKKRMAVFDEEMRSRVLDRFEVELELRQAIERDEFTLYYQPEVNLDTGQICAVEALLRWEHPRRGLLTAGAFIETAEESGLVVEIGDAVLREAIGQLAQWQHDHPELEMWINISPAQLMSRDLATQIQQLVDEFAVNPNRICLEVTEHVGLGDLDSSTGVLRRLRQMGVKLALDDFGTGYSSMKQLKQLPINTLKIDMTFVAGLGISDHDSAIVDAAITLAAAFGLDTVAEGVETHQQIAELRRRGCDHAQGFLLAKPGPPSLVGELLREPLKIEQLV